MVFIALDYNSGSQNILINDWYACLHVLSKPLVVWNVQFVCWVITPYHPVFLLIRPHTGIEVKLTPFALENVYILDEPYDEPLSQFMVIHTICLPLIIKKPGS